MDIGGLSLFTDGYSRGQRDSIDWNNALNKHTHDLISNNFLAAVQPLLYRQEDAKTANATLGALYNADQYGLYRLGYPGQQALQAMGSWFAPQLGLNNYWLQLMQQGALMASPMSWLGMQGKLPSAAFGG